MLATVPPRHTTNWLVSQNDLLDRIVTVRTPPTTYDMFSSLAV